jgi:hypothetical protein
LDLVEVDPSRAAPERRHDIGHVLGFPDPPASFDLRCQTADIFDGRGMRRPHQSAEQCRENAESAENLAAPGRDEGPAA